MSDVDLSCAIKLDCPAIRWRGLPLLGEVLALDSRPRDVCGRRRSPATLPGARKGVKPANAGLRFEPSPLVAAEVLAIMDQCGQHPAGVRDRALIGLLWRTGLRISEALALHPHDLDRQARTVTVRKGKNSKFGISGMDDFGWELIDPWLKLRSRYPAGPVFCIVEGGTRGQRMGAPAFRVKLKNLAQRAGIEKRVHPHALRHSHACDLAREHVGVHLISRQLRHSNLGTTATYLAGIAPVEVVEAIAARPTPGIET